MDVKSQGLVVATILLISCLMVHVSAQVTCSEERTNVCINILIQVVS